MAEQFNLKLLSYNSTGFNAVKGGFIAALMSTLCIDFLFMQEHWLMRSNVFKLENELSNLNSFIVPAFKQNDYISGGRASGGLAIFWRNSLNTSVKQVNIQSNRVHAVEFDSKVILINTYFPCDTQNNKFNETELANCLEDINNIISSYPNHKVINKIYFKTYINAVYKVKFVITSAGKSQLVSSRMFIKSINMGMRHSCLSSIILGIHISRQSNSLMEFTLNSLHI